MQAPISSLPDTVTASMKKTNRQLAYEKALCINKSHFGETVTGRNMTESKMLAARLALLEKDKRLLERDHFWKQRQFLITKAFDKERRLKYSQLLNGISSKDKNSTKPDSPTSERCTLPSIKPVDASITRQFFPSKIDLEKSSNYKRIFQEKRKLRATVNALRAALIMNNRSREKKFEGNDSQLETDNLQNTFLQESEAQSTTDNEKLETTQKQIKEAHDNNFLKLVVKTWKSYKKQNLESEPQNKTSPETKSVTDTKSNTSKMSNHKLECRQSLVRTNTDELLLRLAKTLPRQVMTDSSNNLTDISAMLGFSSRNKALQQRELDILRRPVLVDDRFINLQNSLIRFPTSNF